ncbi:nucleoside 2-deoxyribosyltransferase domain-containing protein [Aureispira sp. CCB-E]|uniref:nucleoside 2-deoxyribosyltransferase domain-containing protein n=1 Tax=Aureispira sp. CCB-E TaxID=3051121 RepID=UPI002868423B|nr:nucleoside 2-deoxyribosyltransferase domain-containing protein [Aureispira sp. CCB-E]WMX17561.1 nucleoside 2-deoxyribosyltransferase domain-containing protein [Aureispira sp. CCB-E]
MKNIKVFLGGTCNKSTWRTALIPKLKIDYFNPLVEVWTEEAYQEELLQRERCNYCLYVITVEMIGVYSIAEAIDDSNKRPKKTIFCFIEAGFSKHQIKSLKAVGKMVQHNGAYWFKDLNEVALFLNQNQ